MRQDRARGPWRSGAARMRTAIPSPPRNAWTPNAADDYLKGRGVAKDIITKYWVGLLCALIAIIAMVDAYVVYGELRRAMDVSTDILPALELAERDRLLRDLLAVEPDPGDPRAGSRRSRGGRAVDRRLFRHHRRDAAQEVRALAGRDRLPNGLFRQQGRPPPHQPGTAGREHRERPSSVGFSTSSLVYLDWNDIRPCGTWRLQRLCRER